MPEKHDYRAATVYTHTRPGVLSKKEVTDRRKARERKKEGGSDHIGQISILPAEFGVCAKAVSM